MPVVCRRLDFIKPITIPQVAHHEAGHAAAAGLLGGRIDGVEIFDRPGERIDGVGLVRGVAWVSVPKPRDTAVMLLAGACAEARFLGIGWSRLVQRFYRLDNPDFLDFCAAVRVWQYDPSGIGKSRTELLEDAIDDAHRLLDERWPTVKAIAHALVRRRGLTGDQVAEFVADPVCLAA